MPTLDTTARKPVRSWRVSLTVLGVVLLLGWAAAWALRVTPRRAPSWGRDTLAGSCLVLAAWIKLYPALLVLCLVVFRRHRALLVCEAVGSAIGGVAAVTLSLLQRVAEAQARQGGAETPARGSAPRASLEA